MNIKSAITLALALAIAGVASSQSRVVGTPANSVNAGGQAVTAINLPNPGIANGGIDISGTFDRSWTTYFIGQSSRYVNAGPYYYFTIRSDGAIVDGFSGALISGPPYGLSPVVLNTAVDSTGCGNFVNVTLTIAPIVPNGYGSAPTGWDVYSKGGAAGSGGGC